MRSSEIYLYTRKHIRDRYTWYGIRIIITSFALRDVAFLAKIILFREVLEPEEMHKYGISTPHTSHCLPTGEIMISTMGNLNGDGLGEFFCIDTETLRSKGTWTKSHEKAAFGYDFWYQPYHDALIATEWGAPKVFKEGFIPKDVHDPSKYLSKNRFYRRNPN